MQEDPVVRLRHLIASRKAVFLVGAGVSMQVTANEPSSSWVGFMEAGIRLAAQRTATSSDVATWAASAIAHVRSGDPNRRLAAEDSVLARLGGPASEGVQQWLRESVGSLTVMDPSPVQALAALGVPLLTLNYDDLLEEITGRPPVTWQQPPTMRQVAVGEKQGIIHLHGQWREPSSVVLGSVRYARITSEEAAQAQVNSLSYANALVLVGFGAPLDTVQFEPLRSWLTTSPGPAHYRLVTTAERSAFSSPAHVEEQRHLLLVDYGSHYGDLAPFLRCLGPRTETGSRRHYLDGESGAQQMPGSSPAAAPGGARWWWPDKSGRRFGIATLIALLAAVPGYFGLFAGSHTSPTPSVSGPGPPPSQPQVNTGATCAEIQRTNVAGVHGKAVFVDSPGQLETGTQTLKGKVMPRGRYTNVLSVTAGEELALSIKLYDIEDSGVQNVAVSVETAPYGHGCLKITARSHSRTSRGGDVTLGPLLVVFPPGHAAQSLQYVPGSTELFDEHDKHLGRLPDGITGAGVSIPYEIPPAKLDVYYVHFRVRVG
jgi:hypothetical protein